MVSFEGYFGRKKECVYVICMHIYTKCTRACVTVHPFPLRHYIRALFPQLLIYKKENSMPLPLFNTWPWNSEGNYPKNSFRFILSSWNTSFILFSYSSKCKLSARFGGDLAELFHFPYFSRPKWENNVAAKILIFKSIFLQNCMM